MDKLRCTYRLWNDTDKYAVIVNQDYLLFNTRQEALNAYDRAIEMFKHVNLMDPGERYESISYIKATRMDRISLVKPSLTLRKIL